jgi:hypothetical protein
MATLSQLQEVFWGPGPGKDGFTGGPGQNRPYVVDNKGIKIKKAPFWGALLRA